VNGRHSSIGFEAKIDRLLFTEWKLPRQQVAELPDLTAILEIACGGLGAVITALRWSAEPVIAKFLEVYYSIDPKLRPRVPWEYIALHAKLDLGAFLGHVILAMRGYNVTIVKVLLTSYHPEVVMARIRNAQRPKGKGDRDAIDTALGLLPQRKGLTIINTPAQTSGAWATTEPMEVEASEPTKEIDDREILPGDIDVNEVFPDVVETQKMLAHR